MTLVALAACPQTDNQPFNLYARKNRPAREVAKLLTRSRNTVYIAKSRILTRFREKLGSLDRV